MKRSLLAGLCALTLLAFRPLCLTDASFSADPAEPPAAGAPQTTALERLNGVIGKWRGIAQPRRGSAQGIWKQESEFVWDFSDPADPAIRYVVSGGQLVTAARLRWLPAADNYELRVTDPQGGESVYQGNWEGERLPLTTQPDADGTRWRITLWPLNEKRTLVLHEKSLRNGDQFVRIAEVGYTREGTRLAEREGGGRECLVTGGTATIAVTYQGETYYVCCSGCRQAFDEDPARAIARYQERLKKRTGSTASQK
ncbi:hypothetical protein [Planctomicrobium sp. SH664]|uniref:hypothetical protein n=1 Tax=Planctomicrobium sp. SH664 TaxID=3448125 RepID=UPI003F5B60A2